ncbi:MAG: FAD-dependent oxidoreductase [Myxococcota bacterium]|nr:FAD-dependent oxidoreductase [Myxococcota bacterium]
MQLGIEGFRFEDLYDPMALRRLSDRFDQQLAADDASLAAEFQAYRASAGANLSKPKESELLIQVGRHVSRFVTRLFSVEAQAEQLAGALTSELSLYEYKREFVVKRVFKKGATDRPTVEEYPALNARMALLWRLGFPAAVEAHDLERAQAEAVIALLRIERLFAGQLPKGPEQEAQLRTQWAQLRAELLSTAEGKEAFGSTLVSSEDDAGALIAVRGLLNLADRWTYGKLVHDRAHPQGDAWSTQYVHKPLNFDQLVHLQHPNSDLPEAAEGPDEHLRRRDGFKLTDRRGGPRKVMGEIDYCIFCHQREKDSCSRGFKNKDPAAGEGTYKKNPLGIALSGCPLEEKISEYHTLKSKGDAIGALAMITIDNPMVPGTGHRICNECMKACIYQKQEPVDIPQTETSVVTDVLALPYGFEIYGLLTRWNPLNIRRPYALPYIGKNALVVGMGPAGYTLAHYLLNEGFGVAGIDGLKIEPFPDELTGQNGKPLLPIRDFSQLTSELDQRVLSGFGGVSEYGITVRWDKNFLTLIHLTLSRRRNLRIYGGIRFGGTLTIEDAWTLGFDHLAIAAGAGKPTIIAMKNNLIRGIRKASDFLMALQLTGAFKKDSLANLQVQLPAVVIGGGLTAIDTATELTAYYPVQVEKVLVRHELISARVGEAALTAGMEPDEQRIYETFVAHGRAIRAERERALTAGEAPNFIPLIRAWGGVSICYRRNLQDSPAYRLNHEEVSKALEEGIRFVERMSPVEAVEDEYGAVAALRMERMTVIDGKLRGTQQLLEFPARTVCVAAGTSPNVTYELEFPGTFELDADRQHFQAHEAIEEAPGRFSLRRFEATDDLGQKTGFFTSYNRDGKLISFYGDNHPTYAGNVVKAMASAKDGHPEVARLFAAHIASLDLTDPTQQASRDQALGQLFARLDEAFVARVVKVQRLTSTIVEVIIRAPFAAQRFLPGQFYRLQNFERSAPVINGTRMSMEGVALTGAWVDPEQGLVSLIVLEMGASSRLCAALQPGEPVILMGPTGTPTEIPQGETVLLAGGGLGNAVLFSIARALKAAGSRVIYFAGYKKAQDLFKQDDIERDTDQIVWSVDQGDLIPPRRPQDAAFHGNVVQAMVAYAEGRLPVPTVAPLSQVTRIIAIGSDRMMWAVKEARHGVLQRFLDPRHEAIGSINSPMQCMMKEICAQCLQKHVDPKTGAESFVFSCFNQDQPLDSVDFVNLHRRLKANSVLEKQTNLWFDLLSR